jgi:hypothetical protein
MTVYAHAQSGTPIKVAFGLLAVGLLVMTLAEPFAERPMTRAALVGGALLSLAIGLAWGRLTIRVDNERLHWHFGPGWPRYQVPLALIRRVDVTRTTFSQGWGIHRTKDGWLYNVAGYDALRIERSDGTRFLLGTDEPHRLKAALERSISRGDHAARRS